MGARGPWVESSVFLYKEELIWGYWMSFGLDGSGACGSSAWSVG